jgi:hypothetical protein
MFNSNFQYWFGVIMVLVLFFNGCSQDSYELFHPVYLKHDNLYVSDDFPPEDFYHNLYCVLRFYNVPFTKETNGLIRVPKSVLNNRELMWNYTTKAQDPVWLKVHCGKM